MDYESKYNELVEAVRAVVEGNPGLCNIDEGLGRLRNLLPEKESEDEKTRNEIIAFIEQAIHRGGGTPIPKEKEDRWISYLEKQKDEVQRQFNLGVQAGREEAMYEMEKEQKPVISDEAIRDGVVHFGITQYQIDNWLKKHINVVEQKPAELPKSEDYGIDGLYAAVDILQKTLGDVDGYQTDDGILEHKCAISAVKELYEQKPAEWSEEDEIMLMGIKNDIAIAELEILEVNPEAKDNLIKEKEWLCNISERIKKHTNCVCYSDCDNFENIIDVLRIAVTNSGDLLFRKHCVTRQDCTNFVNSIKSLRPQPHWKPSEEQLLQLRYVISGCSYDIEPLVSLEEQLKQL